uniref:Fibronectin type-III domain-containing protein n=1 Tax=Glossina morsitans morsitans TaxID=37546 RepID=A0A1B0G4D9_GLOMM
MQDVAGNSEAIILDRLSPGTQYSITVTAIWMGKKYRSRQIVFRTLDLPKPLSQQDLLANGMVFTSSTGVGFGGNPSNGRPPGIINGSETSGDDDVGITSTATNTLSQGTHRELPTKSFSEKRQWQTDDNNDGGNDSDGQNEYAIELQECSKSVENHPIAALKSNVEKLLAATTVLGHSAAVTTSNRIQTYKHLYILSKIIL